jgi:hypothetical protein
MEASGYLYSPTVLLPRQGHRHPLNSTKRAFWRLLKREEFIPVETMKFYGREQNLSFEAFKCFIILGIPPVTRKSNLNIPCAILLIGILFPFPDVITPTMPSTMSQISNCFHQFQPQNVNDFQNAVCDIDSFLWA